MSEAAKRFLSSLLLIILLILSILNYQILSILLIFCLFQLFYEIYFILNKIFTKFNKLLLITTTLCSLIFITYTIIKVWIIFSVESKENYIFLLTIITITVASDLGGYIFGKLFGGKKISTISPNKTYSGVFGSYMLSVISVILLYKNFYEIDHIVLITLIVSTISQLGDMFVSLLKRKAKIKDTGTLLPGHGGLLDRFDGMIFSIPLGLIIFKFI